MDPGPGHRCHPPAPEPGHGEGVRRDRVLVRADQDHRHRGTNHRGPVHDLQRIPVRRRPCHLHEPVEPRRFLPERVHGFCGRLPDRRLRLCGH